METRISRKMEGGLDIETIYVDDKICRYKIKGDNVKSIIAKAKTLDDYKTIHENTLKKSGVILLELSSDGNVLTVTAKNNSFSDTWKELISE